MLVSQAFGLGLVLEPLLSSAIVATRAIVRIGSDAQRARWLPGMAAGECIAVLAHDEAGAAIDLTKITIRATRSDAGWTLNGGKSVAITCRWSICFRFRHASMTAASVSSRLPPIRSGSRATRCARSMDSARPISASTA